MVQRLLQTRLVLVSVCLIWSLAIGAGLYVLLRFQMTPGQGSSAPAIWPAQSSLIRHPLRPTLLMLVHPRCSCSRASLQELARLITRFQGQFSTVVLFYTPEGTTDAWEKTDLWRTATALPGVQAIRDINGREAMQFGGYTSGYTVLYDANGHLLFHGGITPSRGHIGDNEGSNAIATLLTQQRADSHHTLAFGCDLFAPDLPQEKKNAD